MRGKDLLDKMELIDASYVEMADKLSQKRSAWVRWCAVAACLCLMATVIIPTIRHKGRSDPAHGIAALAYNGCIYEAADDPEVLEKYGLPSRITADMAGEHLSYLESDSGVGYKCTASRTDIELYQYAPSVCDGVYILRDGNRWYAALFCNFHRSDSNTSCSLTELYRVYGIEEADDIASIAEMEWGNRQEAGTPVTDRQEVSEFYSMTTTLVSYGGDDFQAEVFGGIPEENQQKAHTAFADDQRSIRIETASGLRFFISFFPDYGWISGGGTMSYYKIDSQMRGWIERNLD